MENISTRMKLMRTLLDEYNELHIKQNSVYRELIELIELEYMKRFPEHCYTVGQVIYVDYDVLMDHMWDHTTHDAPPKPVEVVGNMVKCIVHKVIYGYDDIDGEVSPNCKCCITYQGERWVTAYGILPSNNFRKSL